MPHGGRSLWTPVGCTCAPLNTCARAGLPFTTWIVRLTEAVRSASLDDNQSGHRLSYDVLSNDARKVRKPKQNPWLPLEYFVVPRINRTFIFPYTCSIPYPQITGKKSDLARTLRSRRVAQVQRDSYWTLRSIKLNVNTSSLCSCVK
ncbi:hypothetical protein RvY_13134 [Ramazzottius varieornatus]|uniref:Uncharacterized protein n=1 Tax=Ramazzottius varieornatus TaxID=947166 RepID=A0A1D1VLV1_RAMVA|nr:hypothetical protein RvY_13134 [Ramazzottius varieornatus]